MSLFRRSRARSAPGATRIGILGAGQIVAEQHLPVLLEMGGVEIAWLADADSKRAGLIGEAFGVTAVAADPQSLPDADVVLVAVPYGVREPYFQALCSRVRGFYVEKPFARTAAEHDARCALLPPGGFACGFQRRSWTPLRDLAAIVEQEPFGKLIAASTSFGGPGIKTGGRYSSNLALAGGGILFEVGVHSIDCVVHVTQAAGFTPKHVTVDRYLGFDVHTEAKGVLDVGGGEVDFEFVISNLRETSMSTDLTFEHAKVSFDLFGAGTLRVQPNRGGVWTMQRTSPGAAVTSAQAVAAHWRRYLRALETGQPNEASAETSRLTTEIVEQVYRIDS